MASNIIEVAVALLLYWSLTVVLCKAFSRRVRGLKVTPLAIVYRREAGFKFLDKLEGSRIAQSLLYISIALTILSLILFYYMIMIIIHARASGVKGVGLVPIIPGVTVKGIALIYILVNIGIAILVHELSHAAASKSVGVNVRSTGFILAVIIPAAFIEPDEEEFNKARLRDKAKILSAGPASNLALALVMLLAISMLAHGAAGVQVVDVEPGSPAYNAGIKPGFIITSINETKIKTISDLQYTLAPYMNKSVTYIVKGHYENGSKATYIVHKPASRKYIGVLVRQARSSRIPSSIYYPLNTFLAYGYIINISLALINAAPIFVTDGGRIISELLKSKLGELRGNVVSFFIQIFTLLLILSTITLRPI